MKTPKNSRNQVYNYNGSTTIFAILTPAALFFMVQVMLAI